MSETESQTLTGVPETYLAPLYWRAMESQRPNAMIKDEKAVALVTQGSPDFSRVRQIPMNELLNGMWIMFTREFDRYARDFLTRHPDAVVVHIGCGIDSRFDRVAERNGHVKWYDLDLPEIIELCRRFIGGEGERYHLLACSVLEDGWQIPEDSAIKREGGRGVLVIRVIGFFALMTFLVMYFLGAMWINPFSFPLPVWLRWIGFVIGVVCVIFWTWTQVTLDTQWSAQLQLTREHHLVTTGPYARIRHPLYAAMFGWCIALSLLTANWIFVAICALSILGLLWRVPKEEQMMIEAFGDEYREYLQRTGRFFPKLWKEQCHA